MPARLTNRISVDELRARRFDSPGRLSTCPQTAMRTEPQNEYTMRAAMLRAFREAKKESLQSSVVIIVPQARRPAPQETLQNSERSADSSSRVMRTTPSPEVKKSCTPLSHPRLLPLGSTTWLT